MVLKPGAEPEAEAIFRKWDLDFAVIGKTTDTGRMIVRHQGRVEANIPVASLADSAPLYERPWHPAPEPKRLLAEWVPHPNLGQFEALKAIMGHPQGCSRRWIWEQYDHMVMGDTVQRPGGDAAIVRIHGTRKAIAACCDVTPRYVLADPEMGTRQAVAENWRNLTAVGAQPLAITDNLNYGNPERPEIMGQFVASIRGMADACRVLDFPVVAGNVSLYNETNGVSIPPTPAIGGVGLITDLARTASIGLRHAGDLLVSIGLEEGHLGQSLYQQVIVGLLEGAPPPVDLAAELKAGNLVRSLIREGWVETVHDISDGGLLVTIAEMALAGNLGVELFGYEGKLPQHAIWFGEDQGRYVLACSADRADRILERARLLALPARVVGRTGGTALTLPGEPSLELAELAALHDSWMPQYMGAF